MSPAIFIPKTPKTDTYVCGKLLPWPVRAPVICTTQTSAQAARRMVIETCLQLKTQHITYQALLYPHADKTACCPGWCGSVG